MSKYYCKYTNNKQRVIVGFFSVISTKRHTDPMFLVKKYCYVLCHVDMDTGNICAYFKQDMSRSACCINTVRKRNMFNMTFVDKQDKRTHTPAVLMWVKELRPFVLLFLVNWLGIFLLWNCDNTTHSQKEKKTLQNVSNLWTITKHQKANRYTKDSAVFWELNDRFLCVMLFTCINSIFAK